MGDAPRDAVRDSVAQPLAAGQADPRPPASASECDDGADNDGDGLVDWKYDLGCYGPGDATEAALERKHEAGWSTFDPSRDSQLIYVSSANGSDQNDGRSPWRAVKTLTRGASLVRDGQNDFLLLERGGKWRDEGLGKFKSGHSAHRPLVIGSYGSSTARPRVELDKHFIDHAGDRRSFLAVVGIEIIQYRKDPKDPAFDGETGGGLRIIGNGQNILIEDCRLLYGELALQGFPDDTEYRGIEIRRNVIERNYNAGTCGQNARRRPCGIYAAHVEGLLIEENLLDHNGWNADQVATACATMYNHDLYLSVNDLVVRGNLLLRASSMGLKMRADKPGEVRRVTVEDNLFADGEIGISIGGNTDAPYRFGNVVIRNNVFSEIGLSNPTQRGLSWQLDISDNDESLVEGNLFTNQPWFDNAHGISIGGNTARNVVIRGNTFYGLRGKSLAVASKDTWRGLVVRQNAFVDASHASCLIDHSGPFTNVKYEGNRYSGSGSDWFCVDGKRHGLPAWQATSKEATAEHATSSYVDASRTLRSYAASLGLEATIGAFVGEASKQSRYTWRKEFSARAVNDYIRAGFQAPAKAP
jgi:hypothetical protein